jgi:survival-of-motor-neuron-related-splicing factor 30
VYIVQVEELCAAHPNNDDFTKLRADLLDVITLTSELVTLSGSKNQTSQQRNASETSMTTLHVGSRIEAKSAAAGGSLWYPGVVSAVQQSGEVTVKYFGFGSDEQLPRAAVRALMPHPSGAVAARDVVPGLKITAKYAGDGQWYAARVEEVISTDATLPIVEGAAAGRAEARSLPTDRQGTEASHSSAAGVDALWRVLKVTYLQYSNTETVPLEYIRHTGGSGNGSGTAVEMEGAAAAAAAAAGDNFDIPDHLRLLPTDSEADRKRKRRSVKGLKFKHKTNVMVAAAASRKGSWQDFQTKVGGGQAGKKSTTKRVRGFISSAPGLGKAKSIFATTDKPRADDATAAKKPRMADM